ncbi:thioredoxin family protein [Haloferula sp.]|uniref:thioredoxin family protein n=1 Tax=Haloferula sp. TaxID=2497595 RepID=UPI003C786DA2
MKPLVFCSALVLLVGCDRLSDASDTPDTPQVAIRELSADEYEDFIATPGKLSAVMFHAEWCAPCKKLGPVVEDVVAEFEGKVILGKIDVDEESKLAQSLGVVGIPDLRLFRDGVMVDAMKGAIPKEQVRNHFAIQVAQVAESDGSAETAPASGPAIEPMKSDWLPQGLEPR